MPQVIDKDFLYKQTYFFFYFFTFPFFKRNSGLYKKNLSNQLSNSSTNFGLRIKQPEFQKKSSVPYQKKSSVYEPIILVENDKILGKNEIFKTFNDCFSNITYKQPPEVLYEKMCSQKFHKNHRETPVPEFLF